MAIVQGSKKAPLFKRRRTRDVRIYLYRASFLWLACFFVLFWKNQVLLEISPVPTPEVVIIDNVVQEKRPSVATVKPEEHTKRTENVTEKPKKFVLPPVGKRYNFEKHRILSMSLKLQREAPKTANIAIGCAITSRGLNKTDGWHDTVRQLPLFSQLLPSFCETASVGFNYRFYFAYDFDDPWLSVEDAKRAFVDVFLDIVDAQCHSASGRITVGLKFAICNHKNAPAWAQSDAMMKAYKSDPSLQYFYRVNDDTVLGTRGWTEAYLQVLSQYDPPNVGVVGPYFKTNGTSNEDILTYDFVHRTHMDIFGFYYPRELRNWYADDWITHVHQPRSVRVKDVAVLHTKVLKTRYYDINRDNFKLLDDLISKGRDKISQWLTANGFGKKPIK